MAESRQSNDDENIIFVINCSNYLKTDDFIKEIIGNDISPHETSSKITSYPWEIDNKYYKTDVKFIIGNQSEKDKVKCINGLVVLFDCEKECFALVKDWLPFIEMHEPSVMLLVNTRQPNNDNALPKLEILKWCLDNSFEFVDLNEEIDVDDDFPDTVGIDRVIQALHTVEWSNMQLKVDKTSETKNEVCKEEENSLESSDIKTSPDNKDAVSKTKDNFMADVNTFSDVYESLANSNSDSFDQLFSQMAIMKEKAASMPNAERKAYAEQVAVAFWRAIGGDEDEIDDLVE